MNTLGAREFWVLGWRQAAHFLLLVLLGLGVCAFMVAAAPSFDPPGFLDEAFDTGVALYALLALASGFAVPKGFYLWGVAIVLTHPFAALALAAYRHAQGADIVLGGAQGWVGFAFVLVLMTFTTAMLTTMLSAMGAGLRLLSDHLRRRRSGTPRDVRAQ